MWNPSEHLCLARDNVLVQMVMPWVDRLYRRGPIGDAQPFITQHGEWGPPVARISDIDWELYSVALIICDVLLSVVWHFMTRRLLLFVRFRWLSPTFRVSIGYVFGTLRLSLIIYFFRAHPQAVYTYLHMISFVLHSTMGLVALIFGDGPWAHLRPNEFGLLERENRLNPYKLLPDLGSSIASRVEYLFWGTLQWLVAVFPSGYLRLRLRSGGGTFVDTGLEKIASMQRKLSSRFSPRRSKRHGKRATRHSPSGGKSSSKRRQAAQQQKLRTMESVPFPEFSSSSPPLRNRRASAPFRLLSGPFGLKTITGSSSSEEDGGRGGSRTLSDGPGGLLHASLAHKRPPPLHRRHRSELPPSLALSELSTFASDIYPEATFLGLARPLSPSKRIFSDPIEVDGELVELEPTALGSFSHSDSDDDTDDSLSSDDEAAEADGSFFKSGLFSPPLSPMTVATRAGAQSGKSSTWSLVEEQGTDVVLLGPAQFKLHVSQEKWNASILFWATPSLHSYFSQQSGRRARKPPSPPNKEARRFRAPRGAQILPHPPDPRRANPAHASGSLAPRRVAPSPPPSPERTNSARGNGVHFTYGVGSPPAFSHHLVMPPSSDDDASAAGSAEGAHSNVGEGRPNEPQGGQPGAARRARSSSAPSAEAMSYDLPDSPREKSRGSKRSARRQSNQATLSPGAHIRNAAKNTVDAARSWSALDTFIRQSDRVSDSDDSDEDSE